MKPKLLFFLAWIFYLVAQDTGDSLWLFCCIYGVILAVCIVFYQMEHRVVKREKEK